MVEEWNLLNKQLKTLNKYKENTIGAISRYDVEYMRYYTGLDAKLVPSYGGFYMEGTYKPTHSKYLIFTVYYGDKPFIKSVKEALQSVDIESDFIYDVYKFYKTSDLISHPAVISLPYSVMSFRLVELYALGIPLFIPSLKFFKNNGGLGHDRTSTSEPYCDKKKSSPDLEAKMRPGLISAHICIVPMLILPKIQKQKCTGYNMQIFMIGLISNILTVMIISKNYFYKLISNLFMKPC